MLILPEGYDREEELKPWMAFNQLEFILEHAKQADHFLEWGSGGSSVWFHERLPDSVQHTVIESDHAWAKKVRDAGVDVLTPTVESYPRGHNIECSCFDTAYICRPEATTANVILVDGWNRVNCLAWISHNAQPGTVVFLHDSRFMMFQNALAWPCWRDTKVMHSDGTNNPEPLWRGVLK